MKLEQIGFSWITGMTVGAQWASEEFAEDYTLYSYLILDLFIVSVVFEFSKDVTK
jgi:hypothetical protein